jgi:LemA protein
MKKSSIIFILLGAVLFIGIYIYFIYAPGLYDTSVKYRANVEESWANVQSSYQRRADLIPNLVNTVKGAAENEKEILTNVTQARAGITQATTPEQMEVLGKKINTAINLAFERYPEIRSTQNFSDLQAQLEGTENRINVARNRYNSTVKEYNIHIQKYWNKRFLGWVSDVNTEFPPKDMFKAKEGSDEAPDVKF